MTVPDQREAAYGGRFELRQRSLRQHAARGTIINAAFTVGLTGLAFLKGFILAALLLPADYGVWGILVISLGTLTWLKEVGISDKYIQQEDADQEAAFQKAFTFELAVNGLLLALMAAAVPLFTVVYGEPALLAPGFALLALLPALTLRAPIWVHYRQMRFVRQRVLMSIDPLVSFVVTVTLAASGAGFWSFVVGALVGGWASAIAAVWTTSYRLRLRWDPVALRSYVSFSAPLFAASIAGIVIAQGSVLASEAAFGLAGVGAVVLASNISMLTARVDHLITSTLYPAVCAVRDRRDLLFESFVKSNRLALMWGMPFGLGLALFAEDLVRFVLGERWLPAVVVLQVFGVSAALGQLGFNWTAYFRALGQTRPIAVNAFAMCATFVLVVIPLTFATDSLAGFAAGIAIMNAVGIAVRSAFLTRLFSAFGMARHAARAVLPSVPAVGAVLLLRLLEGGAQRTSALAVAELVLYLAVTALITWAFERELLREAGGYLRRDRRLTSAAAA